MQEKREPPRAPITAEHGTRCAVCLREDYVVRIGSNPKNTYCIFCVYRALDYIMEWKLTGVALDSVAKRNMSSEIRNERERLEAPLPPELRTRRT